MPLQKAPPSHDSIITNRQGRAGPSIEYSTKVSGIEDFLDPAGTDHDDVTETSALETLGLGASLGEVAGLLASVANQLSLGVILPKPSPLD